MVAEHVTIDEVPKKETDVDEVQRRENGKP